MATLDELRELVAETLEAKGVLGKIRAQLRASVYTAIDEQERERGVHLEDPRLSSLRDNPASRVAVDLVAEFLTFYNLDSTLSCFLPEINFRRTDVRSRRRTADDLGFAADSEHQPLLVEFIERAREGQLPSGGSSSGRGDGAGDDDLDAAGDSFALGPQPSVRLPSVEADASDSFDSESFASPGGRDFSPGARSATKHGRRSLSSSQPIPPPEPERQSFTAAAAAAEPRVGVDDMDDALEREFKMALGLADDDEPTQATPEDATAGSSGLSEPKGRGMSRSRGLGKLPTLGSGRSSGGTLTSLSDLPSLSVGGGLSEPAGGSPDTGGGSAASGRSLEDDPGTPKYFNAPDSPNEERARRAAAAAAPEPTVTRERVLSRLQQLDRQLNALEAEEASKPPASPAPSAGSDDYEDDFDDEIPSDLEELSGSVDGLEESDPMARALDDKSASVTSLNASTMFDSMHDVSVDSQALEGYDLVEPIG